MFPRSGCLHRTCTNCLCSRRSRGKVTLGVDPGFRTGCKLAVIDENGKVLDTGVGYFTPAGERGPERRRRGRLIRKESWKYGVTAIAIGNGTASQESEQFIVSLLPDMPEYSLYDCQRSRRLRIFRQQTGCGGVSGF